MNKFGVACGCTRMVIIGKKYVIKIPKLCRNFLHGYHCNYLEFHKTKANVGTRYGERIAPTIFCFFFGLFIIQIKAHILDRELEDEEIKIFKNHTTDTKGVNFGYIDGVLVCVDYGNMKY